MRAKTVFLSSTAKDLKEYREAAAKAIEGIGYKCEKMEVMGASSAPTAEFCSEKVRQSDLYVGILAYTYGTIAEGDTRSYTEIEYDAAESAGIDRLLFVADAGKKFSFDPDEVDDASLSRQRAFKKRATTGRPVASFGTPEQLAMCVVQAIHNWAQNLATKPTTEPPKAERGSAHAIENFRRNFVIVQERIRDLYHLKTLHDQLHSLPKNCLGPLLEQVNVFPAIDRDRVDGADWNLGRAVIALRSAVNSRTISNFDTDWVATLEQARADLQAAADEGDATRFRGAINRLRRTLETQPVFINAAMKMIAKSLRLAELAHSLDNIRTDPTIQFSEEVRHHVRSSVERITGLAQRLDALVSEHDTWQMMDKELCPIEANLKFDFGVKQLRQSWPDLKELALVAGNSALLAEGAKLDSALAGEDPIAIENSFKRFLNKAFFAFLGVDTALRDFCGSELSELKDPMSPVFATQ